MTVENPGALFASIKVIIWVIGIILAITGTRGLSSERRRWVLWAYVIAFAAIFALFVVLLPTSSGPELSMALFGTLLSFSFWVGIVWIVVYVVSWFRRPFEQVR